MGKEGSKDWTDYVPLYVTVANTILVACVFAYSIYWMSISSAKIWLESIGGGLFTVNLFLAIFSAATVALKCVKLFGIIQTNTLLKSVEIILTLLCLTFCCIDLSLSTYSKADKYYQEIVDFCKRNPNDNLVQTFLTEYSTYHSQSEYIHYRSTDAGTAMEGLFGTWIACFFVDLALKVAGIAASDDAFAPLLHRNQETKQQPNQAPEEQA